MCAFPPPGVTRAVFDASIPGGLCVRSPPVREYAGCPSLMHLYRGDYVCVPPARCNAGCPSLMHLYRGDYVCVPPRPV